MRPGSVGAGHALDGWQGLALHPQNSGAMALGPTHPIALNEMARAEKVLASLAGSEVPAVTINSLDVTDAPFLGRINSKLSPIIGNLLERQISELLTVDADEGMHWIRQDPDFPDALLVDGESRSTLSGYEVKAWYVLSTELTGRFRESVNLLERKNIRIAVVAWHLSHLVYGTPQIIDVLTVDALSVAKRRDTHYHRPPDYVCVEPQDTSARTRNLRQTNVAGYKWQGTEPAARKEAEAFVGAHPSVREPPHSVSGNALAANLVSRYPYRLDTNFAKIDRIAHPEIEDFKSRMLAHEVRGRKLRSWIRLLRDLNDPTSASYVAAAEEIRRIYEKL